jgi:hypothetical protein
MNDSYEEQIEYLFSYLERAKVELRIAKEKRDEAVAKWEILKTEYDKLLTENSAIIAKLELVREYARLRREWIDSGPTEATRDPQLKLDKNIAHHEMLESVAEEGSK